MSAKSRSATSPTVQALLRESSVCSRTGSMELTRWNQQDLWWSFHVFEFELDTFTAEERTKERWVLRNTFQELRARRGRRRGNGHWFFRVQVQERELKSLWRPLPRLASMSLGTSLECLGILFVIVARTSTSRSEILFFVESRIEESMAPAKSSSSTPGA